MEEEMKCEKLPKSIEYFKLTLCGHEKLFRSKTNALEHLYKCLDAYRHAPDSETGTVVLTTTITRHRLDFID